MLQRGVRLGHANIAPRAGISTAWRVQRIVWCLTFWMLWVLQRKKNVLREDATLQSQEKADTLGDKHRNQSPKLLDDSVAHPVFPETKNEKRESRMRYHLPHRLLPKSMGPLFKPIHTEELSTELYQT